MSTALFDRLPVIDVDSHVTEPPDTWTSRVSKKWGDAVPHIEREGGKDRWISSGRRLSIPGQSAMAAYDGTLPQSPLTYADMHPAAYDPQERIRHMDEHKIFAEVIYPNLGGFGSSHWLQFSEPELALECVRAYNDFLTDFCSVAPERLVAPTSIPFWDLDASLAEVERCLAAGHRGLNFCNQPDVHGQPPLFDAHWDPLWALVQEAGIPVNFHVGGGDIGAMRDTRGMTWKANFARLSCLLMMDNIRCITDLIFGGVCHRFPDLKLVAVESGVGYLPFVLETCDWQFLNGGVREEHPEYDLLPSEYFLRQVYGCFWFERDSALAAINLFPDNLLYETDFPHPTCQHPGPATPALAPAEYAQELLGGLDEAVIRKVLYENAARIYGVTLPVAA